MVPPSRSMPRTPSRVRGKLLAATLAGSPGSMSSTPCQPRRKPVTSQPRSSADRVIERMQALRPGTSPPPVRIPIRISGARSGRRAGAEVELLGAARHAHLGAVEGGALARPELGDRRRNRPAIDAAILGVAKLGADLRDALDLVGEVGDAAADGEQL